MSDFFDFHHTVTNDEIDAQGHVHNLRYLQWTLWAAGAHSKAAGWDADAAMAEQLGWVVRSHDVTYRAAALAGDEVLIRTWVADMSKFASRRGYVVCRPSDRTVLSRVVTRWVYVDLSERKVVAIPKEIKQQLPVSGPPSLPWE